MFIGWRSPQESSPVGTRCLYGHDAPTELENLLKPTPINIPPLWGRGLQRARGESPLQAAKALPSITFEIRSRRVCDQQCASQLLLSDPGG